MPIHYKNDTDYNIKGEEEQDKRDATLAKLESLDEKNIMDFDEFVQKEGIGNDLRSQNRK
ncbi:hypothetical protein MSP8887_02158 [Marinomonas spartinae]|uniref:Uncharacterized protein n=1 Tax=Marinomonas spartinae TaxID=1792290 RepID=A0A1A8TJ65_9GAMM|nr:hypothetical protein [Marinomonas spartinae]SBS33472.1 hypothetical protein MSP8886_02763 [Marinomonas spartinae]SBS34469.1 hypothetical protein MSP8887_02158 [Marinomonas spartinae]